MTSRHDKTKPDSGRFQIWFQISREENVEFESSPPCKGGRVAQFAAPLSKTTRMRQVGETTRMGSFTSKWILSTTGIATSVSPVSQESSGSIESGPESTSQGSSGIAPDPASVASHSIDHCSAARRGESIQAWMDSLEVEPEDQGFNDVELRRQAEAVAARQRKLANPALQQFEVRQAAADVDKAEAARLRAAEEVEELWWPVFR